MKIIGLIAEGTYIAQVEHSEIEKFLDLYYGKMRRLGVGDTVDLGQGYDYAYKIAEAMRKTQDFVQANQTVVTAILNGLNFQRIAEEGVTPRRADE